MTDPDLTAPYIKRFKELESLVKEEWLAHWSELGENFSPRKGRYLNNTSAKDNDDRGNKRNRKIINPTPLIAARNLSAGLFGNLTSPTGKWFNLTVRDDKLRDDPEVSRYLYDLREALLGIFSASNFYGSLHSIYDELGVYGTAAMLIEEDFDNVIRCRPFTIGEFYLALNSKMEPSALYRQYSMTVRQLVEEFGRDNVSSPVKYMFDNNQGEVKRKVIHCIQPNTKNDPAVGAGSEMAYESVYFEEESNEGKFLRVGGYHERPFMAPRWDVTGSDTYGRCPAMDSLGDAKMLQKMEEKKLKGLDKAVDPPLVAPPGMVNNVINSTPGGVTYEDSSEVGRAGVRPLYMVQPDFQGVALEIANVENRIRTTFFNDLFQSFINETKRMTALETSYRREEKLAMLGPMSNRFQTEGLENAINRTFAIAQRMGALPLPPESLMDKEGIEIQYVSALAQAQQAVTTQSIEQVFSFAGNLSAANPEILDRLNFDEALEDYAESYGFPQKALRSDAEVEEIRAQRAQAQQAAVQQQMITENSANAKVLSETQVGNNSALDAILGG
jgi:hypothetical protein